MYTQKCLWHKYAFYIIMSLLIVFCCCWWKGLEFIPKLAAQFSAFCQELPQQNLVPNLSWQWKSQSLHKCGNNWHLYYVASLCHWPSNRASLNANPLAPARKGTETVVYTNCAFENLVSSSLPLASASAACPITAFGHYSQQLKILHSLAKNCTSKYSAASTPQGF